MLGSPSYWPDERRLSHWWFWLNMLALFSGTSAGREAFESLVGGMVPRRVGRTRGVWVGHQRDDIVAGCLALMVPSPVRRCSVPSTPL